MKIVKLMCDEYLRGMKHRVGTASPCRCVINNTAWPEMLLLHQEEESRYDLLLHNPHVKTYRNVQTCVLQWQSVLCDCVPLTCLHVNLLQTQIDCRQAYRINTKLHTGITLLYFVTHTRNQKNISDISFRSRLQIDLTLWNKFHTMTCSETIIYIYIWH